MAYTIEKDSWGKPIWNPEHFPFVVRSYRQSSIPGNHGWAVSNVGFAYETYEEARAIADTPMGRGEISRSVCQAINPTTWQSNGSWHTCFERKRGGVVKEPGPR